MYISVAGGGVGGCRWGVSGWWDWWPEGGVIHTYFYVHVYVVIYIYKCVCVYGID